MTPTRTVGTFVVTVAVAFITGCGGGNDQSDLVSASKCLVPKDGATADLSTPLHGAMSGGGLRVTLSNNEVQLGFGKDGQEARKIGDEVKRSYSGTIAAGTYPPDEVVTVRKNVVLAWKAPPSEQERAAVETCLA